MRQAYGGTWLMQLIIVFILLFAVYIVLTLDYSKTIKVKNEAISIIEKYDGLNQKSIETLNNYLAGSSYLTKGVCGEGDNLYGTDDLTGNTLEDAEQNKKYYYCIKKYRGTKNTNYYQISLFYNFNINFFGVSTYYTIKGTTSNFEPHDDEAYGGSLEYDHIHPTDTNNNSTNPPDSNNPSNPPSTDNPPNGDNNDKEKYTITFDLNGAKFGHDWSFIKENRYEGEIEEFDLYFRIIHYDGHTLDHYVDQDGNIYYESNASFIVTKDMTLTAIWK